MKKLFIAIALILPLFAAVALPKPAEAKPGCIEIKSGLLLDSYDETIPMGFNQWGYNYKAHKFEGNPCGYVHLESCMYLDTYLMVKWNDAFLANNSCDGDYLLDEHYGYESYMGSGAREERTMSGEYEKDGQTCVWDYYIDQKAVPDGSYVDNGIWYDQGGNEIGPVSIEDGKEEFAIMEEIANDSCQ